MPVSFVLLHMLYDGLLILCVYLVRVLITVSVGCVRTHVCEYCSLFFFLLFLRCCINRDEGRFACRHTLTQFASIPPAVNYFHGLSCVSGQTRICFCFLHLIQLACRYGAVFLHILVHCVTSD